MSCFLFLLGLFSFSLAAGFEQLFHSSMKRSRNFGQATSPWCLYRTGRMLIDWKSTVELFPLVSEPVFKGTIDRTKLILPSTLWRPGRPVPQPVFLTLQWLFLGRCWYSRELSGLSALWSVVLCLQYGNYRECKMWARALQRQPVVDSLWYGAGSDSCLSLSPRHSLSLGVLAKLQFCTSCGQQDESNLQHLLRPCSECCNCLHVVCSDHKGRKIQNGKTSKKITAWRRYFSVTFSNPLKV